MMQPIGFDLSEEPELPDPPAATISIDDTSDLDVCADLFLEFLYRPHSS